MHAHLDLLRHAVLIAPAAMLLAAAAACLPALNLTWRWRTYHTCCALGLAACSLSWAAGAQAARLPPGLAAAPLGLVMATLVQFLGSVIGAFSDRYLRGEPRQPGYVAALAGVLAAVQVLLLADHWLVLVPAWALVGWCLELLLCFYPERPFALLAAHKKRLADRVADLLLLVAAGLAWSEVGSGSFSDLAARLADGPASLPLQFGAVCLVVAVVLRSALLPVHGWLIQVMEAPTPVSALLHAGVVNLGGCVLIRFAPWLDAVPFARGALAASGLVTAVLAGLVMLTRISVKVRLAWSTVAQMGFMLLECGVGLYSLAALHLLGHSLYKAHAFLSASGAVRAARLRSLHPPAVSSLSSLWLAPLVAMPLVELARQLSGGTAWPWWWSLVLGLAWAPVLWQPANAAPVAARFRGWLVGAGMTFALAGCALAGHALLGVPGDHPHLATGLASVAGLALLYLALALIERRTAALESLRRWSYAGFHLDEAYTRLVLLIWPDRWMPDPALRASPRASAWALAGARQ